MAKNYAYITLLTNDKYFPGVILLNETLKVVKSKYPLYVMITEDVPLDTIKNLAKANINTIKIDKIPTPDNIYQHNLALDAKQAEIWKDVLSKYQVMNLTQFDKVILLDCDLMILKNLDHCFEMKDMTAAVDGEYTNLWPTWKHFNSGFMVLEPRKNRFEDLLEFIKTFTDEKLAGIVDYMGKPYLIADQEMLNLYNKDWYNDPERQLGKYYNMFPCHVPQECADDMLRNGYFIHFVGVKPWQTYIDPVLDRPTASIYNTIERDYLNLEAYVLAYAYLDLYFAFDYNIDWDKIISSGIYYNVVADDALQLFRQPAIAEKYSIKALQIDPTNESFIKINESIKTWNMDLRKAKIIIDMLGTLYADSADGEFYLSPLGGDMDLLKQQTKDNVPNNYLVSHFWDIIKRAFYIQYDNYYTRLKTESTEQSTD